MKIPLEFRAALRHRLADTDESFQEFGLRLIRDELTRATRGGPVPISTGDPEFSVPRAGSGSDIPGDVLEQISNYAGDPAFLDCLRDVCRIWRGGDSEIQDAILRNCRVFARIGEAVTKVVRHGSTHPDESPASAADLQAGVAELMAAEAKLEQATRDLSGETEATPGGGDDVAGVESQRPRKARGGRGNRR